MVVVGVGVMEVAEVAAKVAVEVAEGWQQLLLTASLLNLLRNQARADFY